MRIQAPALLKTWYDSNISTMQKEGIKVELRLPSEDEALNKASLALDCDPLVASLTIWGSGMLEYIVMKGESGDNIYSSDAECKSETELTGRLDENFLKFRILAMKHR